MVKVDVTYLPIDIFFVIYVVYIHFYACKLHSTVDTTQVLWRFGAVGSDVGRINEVTLRRARLVLGWVTVSGFNSRCGRLRGRAIQIDVYFTYFTLSSSSSSSSSSQKLLRRPLRGLSGAKPLAAKLQ